ncbi:endonuclease III [Oribacterium sp. C9]|uniref:endonuclease III n=1 Tax=Oribacterium sp. C9 TaxID=1943579 RepID=UPI00098F40E6|nr:endonuclease III [Oribacterium sp. C9]OON86398.1 endonuclease III [Oribacterium sp. C9]
MFVKGESRADRTLRVDRIMERLDSRYGSEPPIFLKSSNAWQLLFATILSAQCTDERVNKVTEKLFKKYINLEAFAEADILELEEDIRSTGFYHNKAKNIKACAGALLERFAGVVPDTIEELTSLPGVGRKTGNLILGHIYNKNAIVVDTHVKRVSNRLGLADSQDPEETEYQLNDTVPEQYWIRWNTHIISLGRSYCKSAHPDCEGCFVSDLCPSCGKEDILQATRAGVTSGKSRRASGKKAK